MLFGHLAVSALAHRYLKVEFVPVMVAGVFPDIVDKTLCQGLHWLPSGRMLGHTLLAFAFSTAVVGLIWGKRTAWSWAVGYLGHLLGDAYSEVPWFYPFVSYTFKPSPDLWENLLKTLLNPVQMTVEILLTIWAVVALRDPIFQLLSRPVSRIMKK
ncbi:MAG: metal-dependent hydrolase [Anaerolineae bacterium]|nr:metal-dependent hydrolase [Anaerolineae bacterium]